MAEIFVENSMPNQSYNNLTFWQLFLWRFVVILFLVITSHTWIKNGWRKFFQFMLRQQSTNLLKIFKLNVHQTSSAQHFQHLGAEISRDGLYQTQSSRDRVLGVSNFLQMRKDGHKWTSNSIEFSCRQKIVQREIFHERIVVVYSCQSLLQTYKEIISLLFLLFIMDQYHRKSTQVHVKATSVREKSSKFKFSATGNCNEAKRSTLNE